MILDARYEKVRLEGVIQSQAVFIALGINEEGRRQVLGVDLSNRESQSSWTTFVKELKTRGLHGVEFVVSDDHAGIKRAVRELLPEAVWQRCYVHFWVYPGFPTLFWGLSGFFVNDLMGKALWSSRKTRSVFQGAVGAFCASTAPSASTGPICMRQDRRVLGLQSTRE